MASPSIEHMPLRLHALAENHEWTRELLTKIPDQDVTPESLMKEVGNSASVDAHTNAFFQRESELGKPLRLLGKPASWRHFRAVLACLRTWLEHNHVIEKRPRGLFKSLTYSPTPQRILSDRLTAFEDMVSKAESKRRARNVGRLVLLASIGATRNPRGKITHAYFRDHRKPSAEEQKDYSIMRAHEIVGFTLDHPMDETPAFPQGLKQRILDEDALADSRQKWKRRLELLQSRLTRYIHGLDSAMIAMKDMEDVQAMEVSTDVEAESNLAKKWLKESNEVRKQLQYSSEPVSQKT